MTATKDDGTIEARETLATNVIARCAAANRSPLRRERLKYIVIHRTSLVLGTTFNPDPISDLLLDGPQLARRFRVHGLGTGGLVPYHFLVLIDGTIHQMLPLTVRGAHAKGYNHESIGIAVVGANLETMAPLHLQTDKLAQLVGVLRGLNGGLTVVGHTDLPGASADEDKVCPGPHLAAADVARWADAYMHGGVAGGVAHLEYALGLAGVRL